MDEQLAMCMEDMWAGILNYGDCVLFFGTLLFFQEVCDGVMNDLKCSHCIAANDLFQKIIRFYYNFTIHLLAVFLIKNEMKKILVIGAGRSASVLIEYLKENSAKENWIITVGDISHELAKQKTGNHPNMRAIALNINEEQERKEEINNADIVISMLPASLHFMVAKDCLHLKKHLVTASYVSKEIKALDAEAKKAGIIFMNEIGLDPGIDHMSAMRIIDQVKEDGSSLISFKSYCGGLVAPESNDNPWFYKFTWNPRNVILAGQGTAQYIDNGKFKYIPYNRLFTQTERITIENQDLSKVDFEAYANRDSLSYREPYGLEDIPTMLRGTLRMPGFSRAWNALVKLGWTDDSYTITDSEKLTYKELMEAYLPIGEASTRHKLAEFIHEHENSEVMQKLQWLGIFEEEAIKLTNATPAQVLQDLLERKWMLKDHDIDMVVMKHEFETTSPTLPPSVGEERNIRKITSSLIVKGENQTMTAMAKTVGLPVGIVTKLILNGEIKSRGVLIPTIKEIYEPVLKELENFGIKFIEKTYSR